MKVPLKKILLYAVAAFVVSLAMAVVYYVLFALVLSTGQERRLLRENRLMRRELPEVERTVRLLRDEMEYLEIRDENVYKMVFKSDSPKVDELEEHGRTADLLEAGDRVDENWKAIFSILGSRAERPPLVSPIKNLEYTKIGASVGQKMNPFYKVQTFHDGVDIIAPGDTPVYAAAPGYVTAVQSTDGGKGNMVEITHSGGYVTRYAHLSKSLVSKGMRVSADTKVGLVGDSGRSFTTHLHYEILKDGEVMNPLYWFGGSTNENEYLRMLVMGAYTGQSQD